MLELLAGERKDNESDRAVQACNDYLRLGAGRSLRKLAQKYNKVKQTATPTDSLSTLGTWSTDYEWKQRSSLYDAELEAKRNEKRRKEFEAGLALDYERVNSLKRLANRLEDELKQYLWLDDVKSVGSGENAERVELIRFNSALVEQYRATLDDIAKETGGRKVRTENLNIDLSKLSDDQLARVIAGEDPMQVVLSGYTVAT